MATPVGTDRNPTEPSPEGGGIELFPVNFTAYRQHPALDTEAHVRAIADLLAPYGPRVNSWTTPEDERDRQAVEDRLGEWKRPTASRGGNTVLYWVGHGSAEHLAHHRTPAPIDDGISPEEVARAIGSRQIHPDSEDSWAIVVIDACFSQDFAQEVHRVLLGRKYRDAGRYLLLSTAAEGYTELGAFTGALRRVLSVTFRGKPDIGLAELGVELNRELRGGYRGDRAVPGDRLVRLTPDAATTVSAPLDQLAELQDVIDRLPTDEQRHFLPKASGAELGELAWYFHGRTEERDHILRWLATATRGTLVVTGPAGSGKSALLGHVLLHTRTRLRDVLVRHGHLTALPAEVPCPDDPFDLVAHLSGLSLARTVQLVAEAVGLPDLVRHADDGQPPAVLAARLVARLRARPTRLTLLFDALDEAEQPLLIAALLLRPLAALPAVRVVIGTRRSTHEGPDQPAPTDTDILDALRPRSDRTRPTRREAGPRADVQQWADVEHVEVKQDPQALAGYLHAKLDAARQRGALDADDATIEDAVHRLVADHQQHGAEPQQFLYVRLAAHELLNDPGLLSDPTPLIGRTHRQLFTRALQRLHRTNPDYAPLLRALGLAQGRGLPAQDGIWALAADALAVHALESRTDTGAGIPELLRDAAPYLTLDHEHERSVYRLAHRTFTEHFTADPDTAGGHALLTAALARHGRQSLGTQEDAAAPPDAVVSPYIRHHLAAHARLGHTAGALHTLADHTEVLDALDLTSITAAAFDHGLPSHELPPAIAGTVLLQHHARDTAGPEQSADSAAGWRRWWRRLGTSYIQGAPPPAEARPRDPRGWPPELTVGEVRQRQLHLQLTGHTDKVNAVALFTAPDGTPRLASAGADRTVRIWDPATRAQDGPSLTGHTDKVRAVTVFTEADGTVRLASGGDDGAVRIWDPATGTQDGVPLTGHGSAVAAVAAFTAPDGTVRLATGGDDKTVRIWDPATRAQEGRTLTGHTDEVNAVAVFTAPDGTARLATGSDDKTVRIWNPATGAQEGRTLTGHSGVVLAVVAFTAPDGTARVATTGGDGTVRIWDPATSTQDGETITGHNFGVAAMMVLTAADGTPRLATGSYDGAVRVWNPATGALEAVPVASDDHWVSALVQFTAADGTPRLATGGEDHTVRIWNPAARPQEGEPVDDGIYGVMAVVVFTAPDGTPRLATGSHDKTVRIWNLTTGRQEGAPLTGHTSWLRAMAVFTAPDGTPRLAAGDGDGTVRIWNPATRAQEGVPLTGNGRGVDSLMVVTPADGTPRLAAGDGDGNVRIWNPITCTQEGGPLTGSTSGARKAAVFDAADGTPRLAVGGGDGTVRVWNPATGALEGAPLTCHDYWVSAVVAFDAPDGTARVASCSIDKTVRIWDPHTRTGQTLNLADGVEALAEGHGLLIAGTRSGYLAIDIASLPTDPAGTGTPDAPL
ncbi:hypothetical protein ACGF0D_41110 [Kitasatospora sp. NPDC048298]|uniref:hypothetical protein n=1 Tax=Kitasatospora sp. NPDC048298 TaxID=3364049 RepID=UPI003715C974